MNILLEKGILKEKSYEENFAYILNDNTIFSSTEYKVLQSQNGSCFVKCMKMLYNGKVQIYYLTNTVKSFSSMLESLDTESFFTVVLNLLGDIIEVKKNGFLSCQNIDTSLDRIYVEPSTYKVSLVYLPLSTKLHNNSSIFENEIRTSLVKVISRNSHLSSSRIISLASDLSNGMYTIEDLYTRIKEGNSNIRVSPQPSVSSYLNTIPHNRMGKLKIISKQMQFQIEIDEDECSLGKNPSMVDKAITFNKMISRKHCKIIRKDGQYFVTDIGSANGTFVNKTRLQPKQLCPLKNGDTLRLANSDFEINIM